MVRDVVQPREYIDMESWVDERTRLSLDLGVVSFAINELGDLFHVCDPVDLGIYA